MKCKLLICLLVFINLVYYISPVSWTSFNIPGWGTLFHRFNWFIMHWLLTVSDCVASNKSIKDAEKVYVLPISPVLETAMEKCNCLYPYDGLGLALILEMFRYSVSQSWCCWMMRSIGFMFLSCSMESSSSLAAFSFVFPAHWHHNNAFLGLSRPSKDLAREHHSEAHHVSTADPIPRDQPIAWQKFTAQWHL